MIAYRHTGLGRVGSGQSMCKSGRGGGSKKFDPRPTLSVAMERLPQPSQDWSWDPCKSDEFWTQSSGWGEGSRLDSSENGCYPYWYVVIDRSDGIFSRSENSTFSKRKWTNVLQHKFNMVVQCMGASIGPTPPPTWLRSWIPLGTSVPKFPWFYP